MCQYVFPHLHRTQLLQQGLLRQLRAPRGRLRPLPRGRVGGLLRLQPLLHILQLPLPRRGQQPHLRRRVAGPSGHFVSLFYQVLLSQREPKRRLVGET